MNKNLNLDYIMEYVIDWQSPDFMPSDAKAKATFTENEMVVLFQQKNAGTIDEYSGRINLKLHCNRQTTRDTYQRKKMAQLTQISFELTGAFKDDSWEDFEGEWKEDGHTFQFSALRIDKVETASSVSKLQAVENFNSVDQLNSNTVPTITLSEQLTSFFNSWADLDFPKEVEQQQQFEVNTVALEHFFTTLLPPAMAALNQWRSLGSEINVWDVAGLKYDEVRNTSVLKWLLDCFGSHGQRNEILISLLRSLEDKYPTFPKFMDKVGDYSSRTEVCVSGEKESRVDIEIFGQHFMLFIEVKIKAKETNNQLDLYLEGAKRKAGHRSWCVLYLTRDGGLPVRINNVDPAKEIYSHLFPLSWEHVRKVLAQYIKKLPIDSYSYKTIQQFITQIKTFQTNKE